MHARRLFLLRSDARSLGKLASRVGLRRGRKFKLPIAHSVCSVYSEPTEMRIPGYLYKFSTMYGRGRLPRL